MSENTARKKSSGKRTAKDKQVQLSKSNHELFFNRELSWLEFNRRVLEESARRDNPLMERMKFLAIFESNIVEFFMIRVAGLKQVVASSVTEIQLDGRTPRQALEEISRITHGMEQTAARYQREVANSLVGQGVELLSRFEELHAHEKKYAREYFDKDLFRVLTPLAIDPAHPFPHIANNRLNLAVTLRRKQGKDKFIESYAVIEVPHVLPRFVELPPKPRSRAKGRRFIPLEEIIKMHANELFQGTTVKSFHGFSILRNSDLSIDEVASDNLLSTIEDELKNRRWGEAVRLTYRTGMPANILEFLQEKLDLEDFELYERPTMLHFEDLMQLYGKLEDQDNLYDRPFIPHNAVEMDHPRRIFRILRRRDLLLHHPYESFQTVTDFLAWAARDPKTLAIKQTLYRTGRDSPIVESLIEAAENGKQVTALVELKARFDEERNITWAREMEKHGIHVVYGLVGLKIHAKMLQVIRREEEGVRAYCHLGTGNYNPGTARLYTDLALFTADPQINNDVTNLFHSLTGYATLPRFNKIAAAPITLRETLVRLVNKEISNADAGKPARIRLKMNSLVDPDMILALYKASRAGVKIELNVRGICCLRPGVPGVSENIVVDSVVGRFLEHTRIFYFENAGTPKVYLSSADWMPRNLNRRVEVMFPVEAAEHVQTITDIMDATFRDNHNRRRLQPDGTYVRVKPGSNEARFSSQRYFREQAAKEFAEKEKARQDQRKTVFQPLTNPGKDAPESSLVNPVTDRDDVVEP